MTQDIQASDRHAPTPGRGPDRCTVLRGAVLGAAAPLIPTTAASASATVGRGRGDDRTVARSVSLRWLGTSGWRIDVDGRTVLFDPYLTRFVTGLYDSGLDPKTELKTNPAVVDAHIGRPDVVLVSHSHWDHLSDVPYIAKTTGARVVGTETTYHLLTALGVDPGQISVVKGGEVLDLGAITVEVVPSLHSRNKNCSYFAPGTLTAPPRTVPTTIADLPEGDTLAFQVTLGEHGPSAFLMGASDFSERAVQGLSPDLAMIAVPAESGTTYRYVPRLLNALGSPEVVVPVHWDNFELPLSDPPVPDPGMNLDTFLAQVGKASAASRIVVPDYRTVYDGDMRPVSP